MAKRKTRPEDVVVRDYDARMDDICDRVDSGSLPLRRAASLALSASAGVPLKYWNFLAVMGKLLAAYEVRFHQSWPGSTRMQWEVYEQIVQSVQKFGIVDFLDAIDLLFSPELKWVDNPLYAILKEGFFVKVLLPKLIRHREYRASVGEQAEAVGGRESDESREVTI